MVSLTPKFAILAVFALYASAGAIPAENKRTTLPLTRRKLSGAEAVSTRRSIAGRQASIPATNDVEIYTMPVKVGQNTFNLLIDTGSSTIWVGGGKNRYTGGHTSVPLNVSFTASYASGSAFGNEFNETVSIGQYTVTNFPIGNATLVAVPVLDGSDGIVGLGPRDLVPGTVDSGPLNAGFDTFTERLKSQRGVPNIVGIYFKPETGSDTNDVNGEITFGGYDSSKFTGAITYAPITTVSRPPFSYYWGIDVATISVGSTVISSTSLASIVDTGTTWLFLPYNVYSAFLTATGGQQGVESYTSWTTPPTQSLTFNIAGSAITLTPKQYIIPAAQLSNWNGPGYTLDPTKTWSWIMNGGPDDGFTLNFIFGQKFLESYYSIYDGETNRVGFAARV